MADTTRYHLPYPAPPDPADVPVDMSELAAAVESALGPVDDFAHTEIAALLSRVTILENQPVEKPPLILLANFPPANPANGDECYLQLTAGNIWHLRYNSGEGSANKWQYVGGPPLDAFDATAQGPVIGPVYVTAPRITVPRPGIYKVQVGSHAIGSGAAGGERDGGTLIYTAVNGGATGANAQLHCANALTQAAIVTPPSDVTVPAGGVLGMLVQGIGYPGYEDGQTANRWVRAFPVKIA